MEVRGKMAIDPVCKMDVDEATAQYKSEYKGQKYYFCSPGCKKAFDAEPEKYLKGGAMEMAPEMEHGGGEAKKPWWKFW